MTAEHTHRGVTFDFDLEPVTEQHIAAAREMIDAKQALLVPGCDYPIEPHPEHPELMDPMGQTVRFTDGIDPVPRS